MNQYKKIIAFTILLIFSVDMQASLPVKEIIGTGLGATAISAMTISKVRENKAREDAFRYVLNRQAESRRRYIFDMYTGVDVNLVGELSECMVGWVAPVFFGGSALSCYTIDHSFAAGMAIAGAVSIGSGVALAYKHSRLIDHAIKKTDEVAEVQQV